MADPTYSSSSDGSKGYPTIANNKEVQRLIDTAFVKKWQILAHCNGISGDQYLNAIPVVEKYV